MDRDELLRALDTIAEQPLAEGEAKPWPIGMAAIAGSLMIVGRLMDAHVLVPIVAGEWPNAFIVNGPAVSVATIIRGATAAPGPTIRLLLTGSGVHVGEWKIGGRIVES